MLTRAARQSGSIPQHKPGALAAAARRLASLPQTPVQPVSEKPAAVLVPLFEDPSDGKVHVVLTLRSSKLSSHSGEVCLPGGKAEPGDVDATATALREAHEECALPPDAVQIVASQQRPVLSKHLLSVTPVIGIISANTRGQLHASEAEVEAIFTCPLEFFLMAGPAHRHEDVFWTDDIQYRLHFFDWQQDGRSFNIWGLTAGILIAVARQVLGRAPDFEEVTPGEPPYTSLHSKDGVSVAIRSD